MGMMRMPSSLGLKKVPLSRGNLLLGPELWVCEAWKPSPHTGRGADHHGSYNMGNQPCRGASSDLFHPGGARVCITGVNPAGLTGAAAVAAMEPRLILKQGCPPPRLGRVGHHKLLDQ